LNGFTTGPVPGANFQRSPATPGEFLIIWGMGLGAAAGYDSSAPAAGLDFLLQGLIVQVIVGGVRNTPGYAGRSNLYPGLDNLVFQLPSHVPTGCDVTLQVRAGGSGSGGGGGGAGHLSNVATIAIAPSGANACVSPAFSTSVLSKLDQNLSVTEGLFYMLAPPPGTGKAVASGAFVKFNGDQLSQATLFFTIPGTCRVAATSDSTGAFPIGLGALDAGTVSISGPGMSNQALAQAADNTYSFKLSSNPVVAGAAYTLSGTGGKDIGAFSANALMHNPITLMSAFPTTIPRGQDLTFSWAGGGSDWITISGSSSAPVDANNRNTESFTCTTTADQGTITVPSAILSQLPATPSNPNAANQIVILQYTPPSAASGLFTAPLVGGGNTDAGVFLGAFAGAGQAIYQ
jgi:hypothetical protein